MTQAPPHPAPLSRRARVTAWRHGLTPRQLWIALGWLTAGLIVTVLASLSIKAEVEAAAQREFDFISNEIRLNIADRLAANAQILHSGAALFDVSETVTRQEWQTFTQSLNVEQQLPGIQGIGFAQLIPPGQLAAHVQEIRDQGFPDYQVWPTGARESYTAIIYLEPFSDRNLRAFGYDMFSEPVRRAAMERARDEHGAALSGKVLLVQETGQKVQAGALMYVPVYRPGVPLETIAQRRAALRGWVYSPYRMTDLMRGALRGWDVKQLDRQIYLQVYDGEEISADTLLYDSPLVGAQSAAASEQLIRLIPIDFAGHHWTLRVTQFGGLASAAAYDRVWLVLIGGTIISLLLFGLALSLLSTLTNTRQMAEQLTTELRDSEEKYRVIFNNEIYAICIFDLETLKLLDVNEAYTHMYGYSREELVSGMTIHDITAEHQDSAAATNQAVREGTIFIPLRYHRKKDGTVFPVEIVGGPYVWQGRKVMFALMHDITERKQAEEALRESEEKYRMVADFTSDWEAWRGPNGTYQYVSPSCERISGYKAAKFLADPNLILQITHPNDRSKVSEHYHVTAHEAANQSMEFEFRILTPSGETRWISHACTAVYAEGGQWLGRRESNRDITDRKQAEEVRAKLEDQTQQIKKVKSLSRMAGAIAHHFNNQLQAVMGNLELAMRSNTSPQNLSQAMVAAGRAAEMSGLMLVYLGQTPDHLEPLDLVSTCARSLAPLRETLPPGVTLNIDLPSLGPVINANATRIQQLLTNLVTNAREALGDGPGSIHLTLTTVPVADIPTTHRFPFDWQPQDQAYACLEVTDTGVGIAPDDIEKLFDPFYSTKFIGRGLGLAVVLGIIRSHSGAVAVTSQPGRGSTFRLFFPAIASIAPPPPVQLDQAAYRQEMAEGGTVLLVEDEETVRHIVAEMLAGLGFTVLIAADGVEAVEMFRQHQGHIGCVLSDLTMPRMDGWETLTALRELAPDLPVILSSGYDEAQVMAGHHPQLPQAFLNKPYKLSTMNQVIRRVLAERKMQS